MTNANLIISEALAVRKKKSKNAQVRVLQK